MGNVEGEAVITANQAPLALTKVEREKKGRVEFFQVRTRGVSSATARGSQTSALMQGAFSKS